MDNKVLETPEVLPVPEQVYFGFEEKQIALIWNGVDEKPNPGGDWIEMQSSKPISGRYSADSNGLWKPISQENFELEVIRVDDKRRNAYFQMVTPLMDEARIKRDLIGTPEAIAEADELEKQALAARQKIQTENPWPTPPTS